jgi:hypothetical protein
VGISALVVQIPSALAAVAIAVGGTAVAASAGGMDISVGGTGLAVAASTPHPDKDNVTNVSPTIIFSKFW